MNAPYLPGEAPPPAFPLNRYLPSLPEGMLRGWLSERVAAGGWVLFPFGEAPALALEAARLGYRVLVATSNPVLAFLQEILADPGEASLWQSALAHLAASRIEDQRLEPYLRAMYATTCPRCGAHISARAYLWHKGASEPHARLLTCPHCGESGLHPLEETDRALLPPLQRSYALHHARALQGVTPPGDALREQAEAALKIYLHRPLIALFTLINQAQGLELLPPQRKRLEALLLSACDRANTLWPHPEAVKPLRTLATPAIFTEWNLWEVLEEAPAAWAQTASGVPVRTWPDLPPAGGGICIFPGRLREAAPALESLRPQAVIAPLPRPNAAFWKQAILWSGWLWGRASIGAWKPLLRRYRYTWEWHAELLGEAWKTLSPHLPPDTPLLALLDGDEAPFLRAAVVSLANGGMTCESLALRPAEGAQIRARTGEPQPPSSAAPGALRSLALEGIRAHLQERGESAPWSCLHAAGLRSLAQAGALTFAAPGQTYRQVTGLLRLHPLPEGLRAAPAQAQSGQMRRYWLEAPPAEILSLADRAEMAAVRALAQRAPLPFPALDAAVCAALPGLLTPEEDLLRMVLASYAAEGEAGFALREDEAPAKRRADLREMAATLKEVGSRLGAGVTSEGAVTPVVSWHFGEGAAIHFCVIASALAGKTTSQNAGLEGQRWIVLPGSRANLLLYKLRRDPALRETVKRGGWQFIKFRHVRRLEADAGLRRENLDARLRLDPLTYEGPQLPLL